MLAADFGVDLRLAAAELVLLMLVRFGLVRLVVDFFVVLRLVAAAERLPPAERTANILEVDMPPASLASGLWPQLAPIVLLVCSNLFMTIAW